MGGVYRRNDSKVWWVHYSINGRVFRESAKTTRKAEAAALLAKREAALFEGRFFPDKRRTGLTMAELEALWLEVAAGKKSLAADRQRFTAIVEHFGPARQVAAILPEDIERFKTALRRSTTRRGKPMAPATVNRHLALLRAALKTAKANGYAHRDPMQGVKLLAEHNERDRICTAGEYERLVDEANAKLRLAILFGYHTGMRLGEIASLRWDQIDLKARILKLKGGDVKTGEGRRVPLAKPLIKELKKLPRPIDGGALFDVGMPTLSSEFRTLTKRLAIVDLRFHDLRHTALTRLRRTGEDIFTIARISGHKDLQMLRRYQTIDEADLLAAVDRAEEKSK